MLINFREYAWHFRRKKILALNGKEINIIEGDVKYLTFQELSLKKIGNIQGNHLVNVGKGKYKEQLELLAKNHSFINTLIIPVKPNTGLEPYSIKTDAVCK